MKSELIEACDGCNLTHDQRCESRGGGGVCKHLPTMTKDERHGNTMINGMLDLL